MAMIKVITPHGWDWQAPVATMLKVASDGRIGTNDFNALIKRAGVESAHVFAETLKHIKLARDVVPMHLIALGASELYGPNRNGDAFSRPTLIRCHPTFEKHAFYFRNHKNKPHRGDPKYGIVKASAYNTSMDRVELLTLLGATKAAAATLGDDIMVADREVEKLARGDDIPVSMACSVPYDVCSGCHNKARTREEYCKEATCKYGGCYNNLTKLVKVANDAHILHVDNTEPRFFDISGVWKPADRTAYGGKADWIKSACAGEFYDNAGAKLAEDLHLSAPVSVLAETASPRIASMVKLAEAVAYLETGPIAPAMLLAFAPTVRTALDVDRFDVSTAEKLGAVLNTFADNKVILPLRDFARLTKRADAATVLPRGTCQRLLDDGSIVARLEDSKYLHVEKVGTEKQQGYVRNFANSESLDTETMQKRAALACLRGEGEAINVFEKSAAADSLVCDYVCYKLAALHRIAEFDTDFAATVRYAVAQNGIV
jgi:hypothetical protein